LLEAGSVIASRYRSGPSRSWLKTKNMIESEFILLGTEQDSDGIPWALLATDRGWQSRVCRPGYIELAAGAQSGLEDGWQHWRSLGPPVRGLRQGTAQWFGLSLRVRGRHLNAKRVLGHTTVKQLITD
jgi:hypothetical protein